MSVSKRVIDIIVAGCALTAAVPLLLIAAVGIWLTSPGPILYRAQRIGRDRRRLPAKWPRGGQLPERRQPGYRGREFTMLKFRTMRMDANVADPITSHADPRVFPFGAWMRATKIDELPQLLNVIRGDMALVGPRPEAPEIVYSYYTADDLATLQVLPGLTSPGTIYYYTHCESILATDAVVDHYVQRLLPVKLALDRVYIKHATVVYDIRVILRTAAAILTRALGSQRFPDPPELIEARVSLASHQKSAASPA